jgi:hypothetical protein
MTIFITKGDWVSRGDDAPLNKAQAYLRGQRLLEGQLQSWERAQLSTVTADVKPMLPYVSMWASDPDPAIAAFGAALAAEGSYTYAAFSNQWAADNVTNAFNNAWNWSLWAYRQAVARLAQYELSVGRPEITAQEPDPSGALDVNGNPVMITVVTQTAVDPLPATVDGIDANGNPVQVPNPAITQDEAERAAAQATITASAADVVAWVP